MNTVHLPDDPTTPDYLERQLVGDHLAHVVSELADRPDAEPVHGSLFNLWDERTTNLVLQHGLRRLTKDHLRLLVRQPQFLLQLQERVLMEGGPFWDQVQRPPTLLETHERLRERLLESTPAPATQVMPKITSGGGGIRGWMLMVSTAASIVVGIVIGTKIVPRPESPTPNMPAEVAWGWSKSGAINPDLSASAYLERLAETAQEWDDVQPTDAQATSQRLNELRAGCSRLLLSPHRPLADADRQWLLERCRAWSQTFDQQLVALENGADPKDVRATIDAAVNKLANALRARAKQLKT